MPTIISTPGAANANSYLTLVEAQAYFDTRLPVAGWDDADDQNVLLIMATRTLDKLLTPFKSLVVDKGVNYYRVRPAWTGSAASATQRLAWPRTGMFDQNGNPIASTVIPEDLKFATAEFAGQLGNEDRTLDNDVIIQGITAIKAGSVSMNFGNAGGLVAQVIPDAVYNLLVGSWYTDELYEPALAGIFDVVTQPQGSGQ